MRTVTYDETKWKLVPVEQYMACEKALRQYTQAPENYHSAVLRMRDALRALINAPDHPATAGDAENEQIETLLDAANEWANYVEVDTAPMTLRKYLERALRASKGGE